MLTFDENGHLTPHRIIQTTWEEFVITFTEHLENQAHRKMLLRKHEAFLEEIRQAFKVPFYQWVNGSFITQKEYPGDIDMVTFLPYDLIVKKAIFVQRLRRISKPDFGMDGFFAPTARWNHRFHDSCENEAKRWLDLFGSSREGIPKGIIQLNFPA